MEPQARAYSFEPTSQPAHHEVSSQASATPEKETYLYYVRLINSKKKSDYVVRFWHDESCKFSSVAEVKIKLMDSFPDDVSTTNIQLGYFEPTKCWIMENRDLEVMYRNFKPGSKITLWCERGKGSSSSSNDEPLPKKRKTINDEDLEEEDGIFDELKTKNPLMEAPKLRLWAKLIKLGRYDSYEVPPPIPLITGSAGTKPKKGSLKDANTLSPTEVATLRRNCLEDLKRLKELLHDGILTETEFDKQKNKILLTLDQY